MGTMLLLLHPYSSCPILNPNNSDYISNHDKLLWRKIVSRRSTRSRATGGPRWDGGGHFRMDTEEELRGGGGYGGDDLGYHFDFSQGAKKRMQWSDYDDFDDWEVDEDDEFWIFKLLRAIGWMLPAVGISLLLGTGSNAVVMAVAVPLVQSLLSLVIDMARDSTSNSSRFRPKTRSRKRPFERAATASNVRRGDVKKDENVTSREKGTYKYNSWGVGDFGTYETGSRFGGWDDLDRPKRTSYIPKNPSNQKEAGLPKQPNERKFSRFRRVKEKPLFLRLMIAAFPFLGSWTRLLF